MKTLPWMVVVGTGLLAACAQTPPKLSGPFAAVDPASVDGNDMRGAPVRWGGVVVGARLANDQCCAEVAAFPVNALGRPYDPHAGAGRGFDVLFASGLHEAVPPRKGAHAGDGATARFLACSTDGDPLLGATPGAVVTVTGRLQRSQVFAVAQKECVARRWKLAEYAGNEPTARGDECVATVPTLTIESSVVWKEPPSYNAMSPLAMSRR